MIDLDYYIAVDGGGTKTETILFEPTGRILWRDVALGCNPLDTSCEAAGELLRNSIEKACLRADGEIRSVFCGVAGNCHSHGAILDYLSTRVGADRIQVCDDTYNVISSALGHEDGCGLVAGTGSALLVRVEGKICSHIGGWGYLIDTGGSGYVLGHDAIYMALRAIDGRGAKTVLTELLARQLGSSVDQAMLTIYTGGRTFIASLAHTVFEARKLGDEVACGIFAKGVDSLAELIYTAAPNFSGEFSVVLGGGLFNAYPEYIRALRKACPSSAKLITTKMPVVYGAAVEALEADGKRVEAQFRHNFLIDYERQA